MATSEQNLEQIRAQLKQFQAWCTQGLDSEAQSLLAYAREIKPYVGELNMDSINRLEFCVGELAKNSSTHFDTLKESKNVKRLFWFLGFYRELVLAKHSGLKPKVVGFNLNGPLEGSLKMKTQDSSTDPTEFWVGLWQSKAPHIEVKLNPAHTPSAPAPKWLSGQDNPAGGFESEGAQDRSAGQAPTQPHSHAHEADGGLSGMPSLNPASSSPVSSGQLTPPPGLIPVKHGSAQQGLPGGLANTDFDQASTEAGAAADQQNQNLNSSPNPNPNPNPNSAAASKKPVKKPSKLKSLFKRSQAKANANTKAAQDPANPAHPSQTHSSAANSAKEEARQAGSKSNSTLNSLLTFSTGYAAAALVLVYLLSGHASNLIQGQQVNFVWAGFELLALIGVLLSYLFRRIQISSTAASLSSWFELSELKFDSSLKVYHHSSEKLIAWPQTTLRTSSAFLQVQPLKPQRLIEALNHVQENQLLEHAQTTLKHGQRLDFEVFYLEEHELVYGQVRAPLALVQLALEKGEYRINSQGKTLGRVSAKALPNVHLLQLLIEAAGSQRH